MITCACDGLLTQALRCAAELQGPNRQTYTVLRTSTCVRATGAVLTVGSTGILWFVEDALYNCA